MEDHYLMWRWTNCITWYYTFSGLLYTLCHYFTNFNILRVSDCRYLWILIDRIYAYLVCVCVYAGGGSFHECLYLGICICESEYVYVLIIYSFISIVDPYLFQKIHLTSKANRTIKKPALRTEVNRTSAWMVKLEIYFLLLFSHKI